MSRRSHTSSRPGEAKNSKRSTRRGRGSCGSWRVRSWRSWAQVLSIIFSSRPKQRFRVASCRLPLVVCEVGLDARLLACERTTTPSFDRWISVSMAWVPALTAPWNAPMVFSGCLAL